MRHAVTPSHGASRKTVCWKREVLKREQHEPEKFKAETEMSRLIQPLNTLGRGSDVLLKMCVFTSPDITGYIRML